MRRQWATSCRWTTGSAAASPPVRCATGCTNPSIDAADWAPLLSAPSTLAGLEEPREIFWTYSDITYEFFERQLARATAPPPPAPQPAAEEPTAPMATDAEKPAAAGEPAAPAASS